MTYISPTTGDRVGLSFITPRTVQDLERRHTMMAHWARGACGLMGRTPDFMNVGVMSMAAASDYCAQNRSEFKQNIERYYEHIREHDLVLTHAQGCVGTLLFRLCYPLQHTRAQIPLPGEFRPGPLAP
jgi:Aromatic ring hydroxylase